MYLRSLTLRGFKSFASSTTFNFEPGITCVVGPNGSGKSNVVDALSWVMGEQGAKTLRGGKMEDVIFAGTANRAPLGRAEVILTIDNTDGALPIDYTEVTISRTMFRSGGSEYAINGSPARLLDIQELLSDSGIGREMHVIVGQGQLDSVLQATPETRRQFIEEAAGILKHRKRKEKALRKLEATDGNLHRLQDLLGELRRQLKPLGRQAEVARKAAVIQAEVRDAKARLMADDLLQARETLAAETADEERLKVRRLELENQLFAAQEAESQAEAAVKAAQPKYLKAQETWYQLSSIKERINSMMSIVTIKENHARQITQDQPNGKDPELILAEAKAARTEEAALLAQVEKRAAALTEAKANREIAEAEDEVAQQEFAAQQQAIADRREGLVRLSGEVKAAKSRLEAATKELERLAQTKAETEARAEIAVNQLEKLQTELTEITAAEPQLDADYEKAQAEVVQFEAEIASLNAEIAAMEQEKNRLLARLEALAVGLDRRDGSATLLAESVSGISKELAKALKITKGYELAIAAALGKMAEALLVSDLDGATRAFAFLESGDHGQASLVIGDAPEVKISRPKLAADISWALDLVEAPDGYGSALAQLLAQHVVVADISEAEKVLLANPDLIAVTKTGAVLSPWYAQGGSQTKPSSLQLEAEVSTSEAELKAVEKRLDSALRKLEKLQQKLANVEQETAGYLAKLHASDTAFSALSTEINRVSQQRQLALAELERVTKTQELVRSDQEELAARLVKLEERLSRADQESDTLIADPTKRDAAAKAAMLARQAEMEARLALRTLEERVRSLTHKANSLEKSAADEQENRKRLALRREQAQAEVKLAVAARQALVWFGELTQTALSQADLQKNEALALRAQAEAEVTNARKYTRELSKDFENLVAAAHKDEVARTAQRLRLEQLEAKALEELGLEGDILISEYGPHLPVPVLTPENLNQAADREDSVVTVPYQRAAQQRRLHKAIKDLETLGKINPLALEEYEALQERHAFLAEQLDDLKQTRADLLGIIKDVDARVEEVFAQAYTDVAAEFEAAFSRLFPGGSGQLVLTDPSNWLTTGVDVEACPPGKKVKRLSLLSGGERSLVAVAFLVALFKARPSPFYILDEVEAALDDTNLGRLLNIYEELRDNSQLLVITHQKRTMEIADALYGVTMRKDGVSTVISQRLKEN